MAEPELIRAQRYHDQAESLRKMAHQEEDPATKSKLIALALQYESLCEKIVGKRLKMRNRK